MYPDAAAGRAHTQDPELPALAHLHACEYSATGYFGKYMNGLAEQPSYVAPGWDRWVTFLDGMVDNPRVNVDGTRILLDACRDAGVGKVVHTSSSAVFGIPEENPVTEDTPPRPLEAYGRAKLQAEVLCREAVAAGHTHADWAAGMSRALAAAGVSRITAGC